MLVLDGYESTPTAALGHGEACWLTRISGPRTHPSVLRVADQPAHARPAHSTWQLAHGLPEAVSAHVGPIVVINCYYPASDLDAVLSQRMHASEVRDALGFKPGAVLVRESGTLLAPLIWWCDYDTPGARVREADAVEQTPEFQHVMETMRGLLERFERSTWKVCS